MGQLFIPIAMGIAFYTAEREVLPFKRTAGNFVGVTIAILILMNSVAYTVYMISRSAWYDNLLRRFDQLLLDKKKKGMIPCYKTE